MKCQYGFWSFQRPRFHSNPLCTSAVTQYTIWTPWPSVYMQYRSHSSRSTSISSFKSKLLQRHWQWEMDLIAREQLVSSLKNHSVRRLFFFFTHLCIPRVLQWEGYWKDWKISVSTHVAFSFFFFLLPCNVYDYVAAYRKSNCMCKSMLHVPCQRTQKLNESRSLARLGLPLCYGAANYSADSKRVMKWLTEAKFDYI